MCFYWFSAVVSRAFFAIAGALLLLLQLGCKLNKIYFCLQLSTHFSFVILLLCCTFPFKQRCRLLLPLLLFFANILFYGFPWKLLHSSSSSVAASGSMENQTVALSLSLETCCQLALFTVVVCVVVIVVVASVATVVIVAAFLRKSFNVTFCLHQHKKLFYFPISCLTPFFFSFFL